ncbi:hypothetical protein SASPL_121667 [Salvia splendens]|uniref:Uncharacterized protein n=1 Tax=Salvia splendens TaxID=180675 RepID=A0A8X8XRY2_SALSN|nr:hypothetical protein SASPL_121667 [Salvia splendens]
MYTEPVSCPLPQMTAAAPADLHHDPSRSSLSVVGAIPPPPATISLSCDYNFGSDSMELIVVDNDEEENDVIHSSVDVSGPIYGSKDGIDDPCNVVFICREHIHVVEHNRLDITMLSNKIDSFLLKEDEDGSIEDMNKKLECCSNFREQLS